MTKAECVVSDIMMLTLQTFIECIWSHSLNFRRMSLICAAAEFVTLVHKG